MAETASGLNFGPQWLRDTFQPETPGAAGGGGIGGTGVGGGGGGGGYRNSGEGRGGGGGFLGQGSRGGFFGYDSGSSNYQSYGGGGAGGGGGGGSGVQHGITQLQGGSKLAAMKLADHRYGREEMLGLYHTTLINAGDLPEAEIDVMKQMKLWSDVPRIPINLMAEADEDEARAWQRGANSDASLKIYKKENDMYSVAGGGGRGGWPSSNGPPGGRGGPERGRGRGRGIGGYERHRSLNEDEEFGGIGGAGRGRGTKSAGS